MPLSRTIACLFLALGFALGSVVGVAAATEQAFANPCPMHQSSDEPCCKGDCDLMMNCAVKCSVPFGAAALPNHIAFASFDGANLLHGGHVTFLRPFLTGPPPPIPIV